MAIPTNVETTFLLGRLNWDAIPKEPIVMATFVVVALGGIAMVAALTKYRLWGYLWHEWFTSIDHKKIGIMYMIPIFLWSIEVNHSCHR